LLHAALRKIIGSHVEQKGSLVDDKRLRFDFSHFSKVSNEEIREMDKAVNKKIRENIPITEHRQIAMKEAQEMGAVALFGEKYGDEVRVVAFDKDYSVELCGGTHVKATGQIGLFKIVSESAIAAGVRRIEAVTANVAEELFYKQLDTIKEINAHFKSTKDVVKSVKTLIDENAKLHKEIEAMNKEKAGQMEEVLKKNIKQVEGVNFIAAKVNLEMPAIKNLAFAMKKKMDHLVMVLGSENNGKANLTVAISDDLVNEKGMNAGKIIKELAKEIQGGGGGQPFFATAGGRDPQGIGKALEKAEEVLK
jgi:alanyl-tRNA synthetase